MEAVPSETAFDFRLAISPEERGEGTSSESKREARWMVDDSQRKNISFSLEKGSF